MKKATSILLRLYVVGLEMSSRNETKSKKDLLESKEIIRQMAWIE